MNGRFRRRLATPRRLVFVLLLLAIGLARLLLPHGEPVQPDDLPAGFYHVQRVVDGDTLQLANHARVRLIGVDTPETVKPDHPIEPWGPEATHFTRQFIGDKPVELKLDQNPQERRDRFDRFLAYIYVDGRCLNEELARARLAHVHTEYHYSPVYKKRLLKAEDEAKSTHRGLWSEMRDGPPAALQE